MTKQDSAIEYTMAEQDFLYAIDFIGQQYIIYHYAIKLFIISLIFRQKSNYFATVFWIKNKNIAHENKILCIRSLGEPFYCYL